MVSVLLPACVSGQANISKRECYDTITLHDLILTFIADSLCF